MSSSKKIKVEYSGSKGWLIFWAILFFPIAFTLLITGGRFTLDGKTHSIHYSGSRGWLCFWVALFAPVAFLLVILNGFSVDSIDLDSATGLTLA